ncbi:glycerol-3-phosphate 1-O-acyltransferase [Ktedonosporobacter rubrisoli]|uniref:Glycerol-3-phosphate acyltransferase n=1 Tax=Ktedonosporobacter rubrisoli TaxID=2509675 RepID=A0A4P6JUQ1_KTERU|nr:glycerol-3-phosphate 1-O-acyltransferase PlsY [Ktedonosporobacter rubrisoli]QBD79378.1 glycerol-3-phosphate 1-O-acyltransferase [Ktedonosporobacter rubrisoli]
MLGIAGSLLLAAVIAYLWGSIPSGYWMGKLLRGKDFDIRVYGSHKIGATNVRRTLGNGPALIVLLVDLSKGLGPTLLATLIPLLHGAGWGPTVAGLLALLGHCFPVFIGFKGGRGVSTGGGALLVTSPLAFVISLIATFSTIGISGYVSLGSIVGGLASIICGLAFYFFGLSHPTFFALVTLPQLVFLVVGPALVILFHFDNIGRLLAGKERKIWQKEAIPAGAEKSPL